MDINKIKTELELVDWHFERIIESVMKRHEDNVAGEDDAPTVHDMVDKHNKPVLFDLLVARTNVLTELGRLATTVDTSTDEPDLSHKVTHWMPEGYDNAVCHTRKGIPLVVPELHLVENYNKVTCSDCESFRQDVLDEQKKVDPGSPFAHMSQMAKDELSLSLDPETGRYRVLVEGSNAAQVARNLGHSESEIWRHLNAAESFHKAFYLYYDGIKWVPRYQEVERVDYTAVTAGVTVRVDENNLAVVAEQLNLRGVDLRRHLRAAQDIGKAFFLERADGVWLPKYKDV